MDKGKQLFFDFFSLIKPEKEELSLNSVIKEIPRHVRITTVRKMLQIHPRKLMSMKKIIGNAKKALEMYKLQTEDLLVSEEEKRTITSLVENTIGGLEFFALKARYKDWGNTKFEGDIELMLLTEKERMILDANEEIKTKLIAELTKWVEEGRTSTKELTAEKITNIYTQLFRRPPPTQILRSA